MFRILEWITAGVLTVISTTSYFGIVGLMALESACVPVPSEIIMPFGGALAYGLPGYNQLNFWLVGLAGAVGCLLGSWLAYYIGAKIGRPVLLKYGKFILISKRELDWADDFFEKRGELAVFVSRLLPVVRTFISLPAGISKMDFRKFSIYTFVGSLPWCFALTYIGYWLGPNWNDLTDLFRKLDLLVIAGAVGFIIYYIYFIRRETKTEAN